MVIPKQFENINDLETMLMGNLLGILICLRDDLISIQQARNYWLSEDVLEAFRPLDFTREVFELSQRCAQLFALPEVTMMGSGVLDELIEKTRKIIADNYTEYDDASVVN